MDGASISTTILPSPVAVPRLYARLSVAERVPSLRSKVPSIRALPVKIRAPFAIVVPSPVTRFLKTLFTFKVPSLAMLAEFKSKVPSVVRVPVSAM